MTVVSVLELEEDTQNIRKQMCTSIVLNKSAYRTDGKAVNRHWIVPRACFDLIRCVYKWIDMSGWSQDVPSLVHFAHLQLVAFRGVPAVDGIALTQPCVWSNDGKVFSGNS